MEGYDVCVVDPRLDKRDGDLRAAIARARAARDQAHEATSQAFELQLKTHALLGRRLELLWLRALEAERWP